MKNILLLLGLIFLLISNIFAQNQKSLSAQAVLQKVSDKLLSLKAIKYKYHQEYNYASEGYLAESYADSFLEFTPMENVIGLKFQFSNQEMFEAYNGSELFYLKKKDKTMRVDSRPKIELLASTTLLQFTPLMLRKALPKIIADKVISKSINETKVNNKSFYLIEITLDKAYIESGIGTILPMTIDRKTIYRLTIDKSSLMPIEVFRGNNINQDFNRTTYSEIEENPPSPSETSWYYSTFLNEYKYAEVPKDNLIKAGEMAFDINLPMFATDKTTALSDYQGKVVLLDFWIFHCGYCQAGVPKLNALQEKYKNKNFKLLTVNVADSDKLIQLFVKKTKSKFPILYQGEEIAKKYGVFFYPTVVLLGKDGKVIYAGDYHQTKLEELIDHNL